ncbi:hypothetical protein WJX82_002607 [Trebouxia sp. C0006]
MRCYDDKCSGVSADPDTLCPAGGACMPVAFQFCESVEICLKRLSRDSQVYLVWECGKHSMDSKECLFKLRFPGSAP